MTTINDQGICYHDIMWRITNACNKMDGAYYFCGKKLGIKENTLTIIYALEDGQPHSQKQISEEWLLPKTTINTVIKECVQKGYLVLHQEAHTKEKMVHLTEAGKIYAQDILSHLRLAELAAFRAVKEKYPVDFAEIFEEFARQLQSAYEQSGGAGQI